MCVCAWCAQPNVIDERTPSPSTIASVPFGMFFKCENVFSLPSAWQGQAVTVRITTVLETHLKRSHPHVYQPHPINIKILLL